MSKIWQRLHVKCPLFLADFNKTWIFFSTDFRKSLKYQILLKSVQWEPSCSMLTDGRTDGWTRRIWQSIFEILRKRLKRSAYNTVNFSRENIIFSTHVSSPVITHFQLAYDICYERTQYESIYHHIYACAASSYDFLVHGAWQNNTPC